MRMQEQPSRQCRAVLLLETYVELLRVEYWLMVFGFSEVYRNVKNFPRSRKRSEVRSARDICDLVDTACVLYFKQVRCLQRSVVMVRLLRGNGIPAELVIGVQHWPFRAHAWVESSGQIVGEKPYIAGMYDVVERC